MTFPVDQQGSTSTPPCGQSKWTDDALTSDKLLLLLLQHAVLQQHMPPPENNDAQEEEAATNSIAGKVTNFATYVRSSVVA